MARTSYSRRSRRTSRYRRRSSRRSSKKVYRRRSSRTPRRHKKASRLSVKKFSNLYPDVTLVTMKDQHVAMYPVGTARIMVDSNTILTSPYNGGGNMVSVLMNANPNSGMWIQDSVSTSVANFTPNPSDWFEQRYLVWRPMGCNITVRVYCRVVDDDGNEILTAPSPTAYVVGFPASYLGVGSQFTSQAEAVVSNYWDRTATLGLTAENVPDLKYGWTRRVYGKGGSSVAKFKKSYSFAKLFGMTPAQYMAISTDPSPNSLALPYQQLNVTCTPPVSFSPPPLNAWLHFAVVDDDPSATNREYRYEVRMEQYGRWETTKLLYK